MTINRRKKNVRLRGSHTHGWGHKKKHRGAGNRGGRGMAGSGKRADQNRMFILKEYGTKYFGKYGFKVPKKTHKKIKIINLYEIDKSGKDTFDASGFKILGTGDLTRKIKITADEFSKKALEKIKKAGGEAIVKGDQSNVNNK